MRISMLASVFAAAMATPAFAQGAAPAAASQSQPSATAAAPSAAQGPGPVHYDFEDDQVEGDLQRPDGELVESIRRAQQTSLIEIRRNFIPEIIKSMEDLE
jgi:hypothetical protein